MKRGLCLAIVVSLFLVTLISSAQTVVVKPEATPEKAGFFSNTFGFLKSPIFWYIVVIFLVILVLFIGVFFLVRFLVKFLKDRSDIFWRLKTERMKMARIQRRYPSKAWYHVDKNTPIRLVRKEGERTIVSSPIAYHRGDYATHDGFFVISMNMKGNNKWLFFPITDILVIPNKDKIELKRRNKEGKVESYTIDNLPQAKDIVQFNEGEILIYAESLSNVGLFYVPVLRAKDGKIIDLSVPTFESLKDVAIGDYLYIQTDLFTQVTKKAIDMNPNLKYSTKLGDSSQQIESTNHQPQM
jgi:hypothetical protein